MINFYSFSGYVTNIGDFQVASEDGSQDCYKIFELQNESGEIVNFIVSPSTYFVDHKTVVVGDWATGYYDGDAIVPLIYPPQYSALVMVKERPGEFVHVSYFNEDLVSNDGWLNLNPSPSTVVLLTNGQAFTQSPANRNLIVTYRAATKSIPAQTTPLKIIVLC